MTHFQSETDHESKEEKTRKKHKVEHVGIFNCLMLHFRYKYNKSVFTSIPT